MERESNGDTNCNWCAWNNLQRTGKGTGRLKISGQVEITQTTALSRSRRVPEA